MNAKPRSLLHREYPPGFDNDGRRVLAGCEEFTLVELYEVGGEQELIYSPAVEEALLSSLFRIQNDTDRQTIPLSSAEDRLEISKAFLSMLRAARKDDGSDRLPGSGAAGERAVRTIGRLLLEKIADGNPDDVTNILKTCIRAVYAFEGALPDKRSNRNTPIEAILIYEAHGRFVYTRTRPTKRQLIERLRLVGVDHPGKDSASKWRATFDRAGLGGLPEE